MHIKEEVLRGLCYIGIGLYTVDYRNAFSVSPDKGEAIVQIAVTLWF